MALVFIFVGALVNHCGVKLLREHNERVATQAVDRLIVAERGFRPPPSTAANCSPSPPTRFSTAYE